MTIRHGLYLLIGVTAAACGKADEGAGTDADQSVAAAGALCALSVARLGPGSGVVTSKPVGITCGSNCTTSFTCGTMVTLAAVPAGSTFVGWANGCSGNGGCQLTLATASTVVGAVFSVCGNSVVEIGEECDDGNASDNDACTRTCRNARCGDGLIWIGFEVCDDGNTIDGDGCSHDCRSLERCGNGIIDTSVGEVCDDGNTVDGDGCSHDCRSLERCGNGIVDTSAGEVCDDGNTVDGDGCSHDCRSLERCGNGIVDASAGEVCDDGNTVDADGCNRTCTSNETCGNGIVDTEVGEVCEPPNVGNCSSNCRSNLMCGNAIIDPGEECDNGLANNGDDKDCRSDCVINRCGDGRANTRGTHHEDCDGAPIAPPQVRAAIPTETASCNLDCTAPRCGDGKVNHRFTPPGAVGPEQCDNGAGNSDNTDCTARCQVNVCGDGHRDTLGPLHLEPCDDGNTIDNDGCRGNCTLP